MVLVVSRPSTSEAYWIAVKDYFHDPARRASRKVHIVKRLDRFDVTCREALFRLAVAQDAGVYLAPLRKDERLISNLLPIVFLAPRLYAAATDLRKPRDFWQAARQSGVSLGGEWILRNNVIMSFCDLHRPEWGAVCDQGTVEDFATNEWSQAEDPDRRRDFVDLLNRTLREMVRDDLDYHERLEFFYFRPTPTSRPDSWITRDG